MKHKKWWDYSGKRWNFDGYICLQYSLFWGLLGAAAVRYGNGLIFGLYRMLPETLAKAAIWLLLAVGFVDFAGSLMALYHLEEKLPALLGWNHRLQRWTFALASAVSGRKRCTDGGRRRIRILTMPGWSAYTRMRCGSSAETE